MAGNSAPGHLAHLAHLARLAHKLAERSQPSARRWRPWALQVLLAALPWLGACGPTAYLVELHSAREVLAQVRTENARFYAPYEYHAARAYLAKAREEAQEGGYEDAVRFARRASRLGQRAIDLSRQTKGIR